MDGGTRIWAGALAALALAVVVATLLLRADVERMDVATDAMAPAVEPGERVTVNVSVFRQAEPELGDIVAVRPAGRAEPLVRRVVARGGQRAALRGGRLVLDGRPVEEPHARPCVGCDAGETLVPAGHWLVLADDRSVREDSRAFGPVPGSAVVGRVDTCLALGLTCSPRR
jgi:signal peptidase I